MRTIKGLTAPNRIFGKGESREQNAIIKVYSVQELKNALTKIYSFKGGIGTIEIAGDITITEPIQLKQFIEGEAAPKEIIIQSIAGARILNGNKVAGDWDYDMVGNTEIPVFDVGKGRVIDETTNASLESQLIIKYTFLDLVINSDTSRPFGTFIASDLGSYIPPPPNFNRQAVSIGEIKINNIKLFNVHTLLAGYSADSSFDTIVTAVTPNIDGVSVRNTSSLISEFYFNNPYFGITYGLVNNIGTWNNDNRADNSNIFNIYTNSLFRYNSFESIGLRTKILADPNATFIFENGFANTFSGGEIIDFPIYDSFTYNNTVFKTVSNITELPAGTIIPTGRCDASFNIVRRGDPISGIYDFVVETTFCGKAAINTGSLPINSQYEINWHLTIRRAITGEVNTYHIKTNVRRGPGNSGTAITIISNNTIAASEEFLGLIDLTPILNGPGNGLQVWPNLPGEVIDTSCVVKMTGRGLAAV